MRIAFISTFAPFRGGIAQFNDAWASAMVESGHEVLKVNWSRQYPGLLFPGETQFVEDGYKNDGPPRMVDSVGPGSWRKTARWVVDKEVDVIVMGFWHAALAPAMTAIARGVKKRAKKKGICVRICGLFHNAASHDGKNWERALVQRFVSQLDAAWTLSETVSEELVEQFEMKSTTLFHPVYDHFEEAPSLEKARADLDLPAEGAVLLFFGLIRPYKGLMELLLAMSELEDPPVLLIAGECYGDWNRYEAVIDKIRDNERVVQVHNRFIKDDEIPGFFAAADALVLPYRSASQSGVTAIALHYDLPVLIRDVGDLKQGIREGETGELLPAYAPGAWKGALTNVRPRGDWPRTAFEKLREELSWTSFQGKVDALLGSLR